jgi:3-dehydroquinate dehydratase-2
LKIEVFIMDTLLLINGPNLNMLGIREVAKYGQTSLPEIEDSMKIKAGKLGFSLKTYQSNSESGLVGFIQNEGLKAKGLVINAGAYTHTSIAIRDAILSVGIPFVEVHMSNIFAREEFRTFSYLSGIALGIISGFGKFSYDLGLEAIADYIKRGANG